MKKHTLLISALALCSLMGAAVAGQRFVVRSAPVVVSRGNVVRQYAPARQMVYGNRGVVGGQGQRMNGIGPHGYSMIQGARGWHEIHNRSFLRTSLPAVMFGYSGDQQVDLEEFIDSIDVSSPIEPASPCYANCVWAVISYAANGASGSIVAQPTLMDARKKAYWSCMSVANGTPCGGWSAGVGSTWVVALYCQHTDDYGNSTWNTIANNGDNFGAATRNAYRSAAGFGFGINDCGLINAVTGDGSQGQYAQLE